eukprot:13910162-Alexandrium_andersonii.AAC.1
MGSRAAPKGQQLSVSSRLSRFSIDFGLLRMVCLRFLPGGAATAPPAPPESASGSPGGATAHFLG